MHVFLLMRIFLWVRANLACLSRQTCAKLVAFSTFLPTRLVADWETGNASASQSVRPEFELPERNATAQQAAAVGVAVAERDAEQPWRH